MKLTYAEILGTFDALKKTAAYIEDIWPRIDAFLKGKNRFVFVGCGSSYSLAKSMAIMAGMNTGFPSSAMAAGDILLHAERYKKCFENAAVVCVSRSGRTSELLMALDALKSQNISFETASFVSADNTPLADKSSLAISTPWAFDNSVCQTRCVTNFYFAASYILAKASNGLALLENLQHIVNNGNEFLKKIESLADELSERSWDHCVVLGDAELEGIAEEAALAFKEICQIPSNYYHLLDIRHGPMVLLGEKTLVLAALGPKNDLEQKLIQEVREKKSEVVAFSDTLMDSSGTAYGHPLQHIALGIPFIILCQMTAYKKSLKTGADPDNPAGLKAWITL